MKFNILQSIYKESEFTSYEFIRIYLKSIACLFRNIHSESMLLPMHQMGRLETKNRQESYDPFYCKNKPCKLIDGSVS